LLDDEVDINIVVLLHLVVLEQLIFDIVAIEYDDDEAIILKIDTIELLY